MDLISMQGTVFSTYVEMILTETKKIKEFTGVLHVCGDDPSI